MEVNEPYSPSPKPHSLRRVIQIRNATELNPHYPSVREGRPQPPPNGLYFSGRNARGRQPPPHPSKLSEEGVGVVLTQNRYSPPLPSG
jgi:hypothetical protein